MKRTVGIMIAIVMAATTAGIVFGEVGGKIPAGAKPVTMIELGSTRCVPCRMMQPVLAAVEKEYKGRVRVVFYDVWTKEGRPFGEKYKVRAIPTQVFLDKDGREYFRHVGYFPKEDIADVLRRQGIE